jgi:hypothetical protein
MATLVLTAVGTAIGGPIGGAIGAMIGQQADAVLFAPKARHGPRLGELAVQTSSYGTQIPKIFGTIRVAGTVIWSTDLQERKSTSGGGKARPKSVNYTYSASFAVALSGRPVTTIRRIWADGKLLRGAAGDFKSRTKFRLYKGSEDQPVDPLIASVEGIGNTPAFRGTAYALFEDFELADYGNRIPSLTFELVADEAPVAIGTIAEEISDCAVADGGTFSLGGYAAAGDSVRGAIEALSDLVPFSLIEDGGQLKIGLSTVGEPLALSASDCGAHSGESGGRTEVVRLSAAAVAGEVSVAYHDIQRDYQTGMQRAARGTPSLRSDRRALPAALEAASAKAVAEYRLACLWAGRATAKVHLGWRRASLRPGIQVRLAGQPGLWKVERWTLDRMVVTLQLLGVPNGALLPAAAASGRPIGHFDQPIGPTSLLLFDLPSLTHELADRPRLLAFAAGAGAGWRRAELEASYDGGTSWSEVGATAGPATMGRSLSLLPAAGSALIDNRHSLEVELLNDGMWLEGRDDAALVAGANLAALGDELIQFGEVEALGGRRFRLSRLLRGRRGTEWAASHQAAGEPFALIEPENIAVIEPPIAVAGGEARLLAHGVGDALEGASAERPIAGEAMRPPSPVHLRALRLPGGDVSVSWVRRSRSGWTWLSGSDTPLGEEREMYTVQLSGTGFQRSVTTEQPHHVFSAAGQGGEGLAGDLTIRVVQLGTSAASRPAEITI